jgi:hypothetical protein
MKIETPNPETCLLELICVSPLLRNVARIITRRRKLEVAGEVNLQFFTNGTHASGVLVKLGRVN